MRLFLYEFFQFPHHVRGGKSENIVVVSDNALYKERGRSLNAVCAGFAESFSTVYIAVDLRIGERVKIAFVVWQKAALRP